MNKTNLTAARALAERLRNFEYNPQQRDLENAASTILELCEETSRKDEAVKGRKMSWIQTYTGLPFFPFSPNSGAIRPEDIAHALSMLCRYGGHCIRFYSVAEHSLLLASAVSPNNRLWALLHDAPEAYLVDVPAPLRPGLPAYNQAEDRLMEAICKRFNLSPGVIPEEVHEMDQRIVVDERRQNMANAVPWQTHLKPLGVTLQFLAPEQAEKRWLEQFRLLYH